MLEHLYIKNVALIKEVDIDFTEGLNILTGETGAVKSIIIDSINFLIGERTGREVVRTGAESASVEGLFVVENCENIKKIKDIGIEIEEDNKLLIERTININGRTTVRLNGKACTVAILKEVTSMLIDVHGQRENQSLIMSSKHIELLDSFIVDKLEPYKNELNKYIKRHRDITKEINSISKEHKSIEDRLEFLDFQIEEIENANLKENEDILLEERQKLLLNSEKIMEDTNLALSHLSSGEDLGGIDDIIIAKKILEDILEYDNSIEPIINQLDTVLAVLDDSIREVERFYDKLEHDPDELSKTVERLDLIYNLKRKYGNTVTEILEYYKKIKGEKDFIEKSGEMLKGLNDEKLQINRSIIKVCDSITEIRVEKAKLIEKEIEDILKELGMEDAKFEIKVDKKKEFGPNGNNDVYFLISPNKGEPLKELTKIASGGEMSRVMLALKTVLTEVDNIDTFIFDEIDTGVSGRTAQMVAEKLAFISRKQQILCVSHLPQIAAMADSHYLIKKETMEESTETFVNQLDYNGLINEISRLLGGAKITDATTKASKELKEMADNYKKRLN